MSDSVKKLQDAFDKINKMYEDGTIGQLGKMPDQDIERFGSGSLKLDLAIGGGYPKGRVIELYGPESSGKTTLAIHAIAQLQKEGGRAGIIDMEHAFDPAYASNLGVNIDELVFSQPSTGEQAWEILEIMLDTGLMDLIVVDSVAAMVPKRELDGDMGDAVIGLQAKMMSQGFRKNTGRIKKSGCTVIFINQIRDNVGVTYGPSEVTSGGKALRFYASIRMEIRRVEAVKEGEEVVANKTRVITKKNKVAAPFKTIFFDIEFGKGIDKIKEVIEVAEQLGVVKRGGSHYSFGEVKLGQGMKNVKLLLEDNEELFVEIRNMVIELLTTKEKETPQE